MIIDTHCHYNLEPFWLDWHDHWAKAQENGVEKSVIVGVDSETSRRAVEIATKTPTLFAAIGFHPTHEDDIDEDALTNLLPNPKIVAIGETGLDYFRLPTEDLERSRMIAQQQQTFRWHIKLAQKFHLPLIIHVRDQKEDAYWDTLRLLREAQFTGAFILHCISGPLAYVQQAIEMSAYIGAAGNVTYKNAEHLRDLLRSVPVERILLETDAPYLPPQPFRGQTCEPWMISKTAEFLRDELKMSLEQVKKSSQQVFQI